MSTATQALGRRFRGIGECIYCGGKDRPLFEEHIIPFAIAGDAVVFEAASCKQCADDFNKRFEGSVLQRSFEAFRFKIGAPSRSIKKKKKRSMIEYPINFIHTTPGFPPLVTETKDVSRQEYPFGFIGLRLRPPKILMNIPASESDLVDGWTNLNGQRLKVLSKAAGRDTVLVGSINPTNFARFLAKIAYSYAVADVGKDSFRPLILPFLKGETNVFTDLVGGDYELPPPNNNMHELQCFVFDANAVTFRFVRLRLFSCYGSPVYHVVVGIVS